MWIQVLEWRPGSAWLHLCLARVSRRTWSIRSLVGLATKIRSCSPRPISRLREPVGCKPEHRTSCHWWPWMKRWDVFAEVDLDLIRSKSVGLTSLFIELVDQSLGADNGAGDPAFTDERGSQVTLRHPEASRLVAELAGRGVIVDHRPPDLMRLGFSPLFNSYRDVWEANAVLSSIL